MREQEGYIPVVGDYRVWYRIVGGGAGHENIPLVALHGGPGVPHDYIENLVDLASDSRRVILYDQLGCGRSDQPDDTSLWRVERFVEELGIVRRELDLERIHLLGQSWGGMLAIEYALTQPQGLVSLILASTLSSMPLWIAEANRLRNELPQERARRISPVRTAWATVPAIPARVAYNARNSGVSWRVRACWRAVEVCSSGCTSSTYASVWRQRS